MPRSIHDPIETLDQDILGNRKLAGDILCKLAGPVCPSALGIYGGWGSGKSSLLKIIQLLNEDSKEGFNDRLEIVVIDAWLYESTGNLFIPVMRQLARLLKDNGQARWGEAKSYLKRVLTVTALVAAQTVLKQFTQLSMEDIQNFRKEAKSGLQLQDLDDLVDEIADARELFGKAIGLILQANNKQRIVMMIDNLDRCSPENAIGLLESVKNFLSVEGCAWVFAVDSEVIASYINKKYEGTAMDGYSYLDKIIPEQYHIPPPSLLKDQDKLNRLLSTAMEGLPPGMIPADWRRYAQIPRLLVPRRLIKSACKFAEISTSSTLGAFDEPDIAFALILLYHGWPDFYERLSSDSREHISGVLVNFASQKGTDRAYGRVISKIPLHEKFTSNQELIYFLHQAFDQLDEIWDTAEKLRLATFWLRQKGLP